MDAAATAQAEAAAIAFDDAPLDMLEAESTPAEP